MWVDAKSEASWFQSEMVCIHSPTRLHTLKRAIISSRPEPDFATEKNIERHRVCSILMTTDHARKPSKPSAVSTPRSPTNGAPLCNRTCCSCVRHKLNTSATFRPRRADGQTDGLSSLVGNRLLSAVFTGQLRGVQLCGVPAFLPACPPVLRAQYNAIASHIILPERKAYIAYAVDLRKDSTKEAEGPSTHPGEQDAECVTMWVVPRSRALEDSGKEAPKDNRTR